LPPRWLCDLVQQLTCTAAAKAEPFLDLVENAGYQLSDCPSNVPEVDGHIKVKVKAEDRGAELHAENLRVCRQLEREGKMVDVKQVQRSSDEFFQELEAKCDEGSHRLHDAFGRVKRDLGDGVGYFERADCNV
jgi:hypothetical protein